MHINEACMRTHPELPEASKEGQMLLGWKKSECFLEEVALEIALASRQGSGRRRG